MEIKRGVIDSDNYFRKAFKPIIEPLSIGVEKNKKCDTQPVNEKNTETSYITNEDDDNKLNSSFLHFFNDRPKSQRYNKSYGMHYDRVSDSCKIGDHSVTFSHGNLQLLNRYYPWTLDLWSL